MTDYDDRAFRHLQATVGFLKPAWLRTGAATDACVQLGSRKCAGGRGSS